MILDLYFAGEKSMLRTAIKKLKRLFKLINEAGIQRHRKKLAQLAEIEETERKVLVDDELTKKFAAAHAVCKRNNKTFASVELSVKEIIFVEGELATWSRYFREREIYQPR